MFQTRSKGSAFTMTETMLAIAAAAAITVTSVWYYQSANDAAKVNQAVKNFNVLMEAALDYTASRSISENSSLTTATLASGGYIPSHYNGPQSQLWDGLWEVYWSTSYSGFYVQLRQIPQARCKDIKNRLIKAGVAINSASCNSAYRGYKLYVGPIKPDEI